MQTISFEVDDTVYKNLSSQIGEDNFEDFFASMAKTYAQFANHKTEQSPTPKTVAKKRIGILPPFNVPDDFDDMQYLELDK